MAEQNHFASQAFKWTDDKGEHTAKAGEDMSKRQLPETQMADFRLAGLIGEKPKEDAEAGAAPKATARS